MKLELHLLGVPQMWRAGKTLPYMRGHKAWALLGQSAVPRLAMPSETIRETVAVALVRLRGLNGMTQEELSKRARVNRSHIADIERRGRNVTLDVLQRLAAALSVTLIDLMG